VTATAELEAVDLDLDHDVPCHVGVKNPAPSAPKTTCGRAATWAGTARCGQHTYTVPVCQAHKIEAAGLAALDALGCILCHPWRPVTIAWRQL